MFSCRFNHRVRNVITRWLVVAFALRALLPQGFMPASEPFGIQICPSGLSVRLAAAPDPHAAHRMSGGHEHHEHHAQGDSQPDPHGTHHNRPDQCPFGGAAVAAPAPLVATVDSAPFAAGIETPRLHVLHRGSHREYRPQPRGPPALS